MKAKKLAVYFVIAIGALLYLYFGVQKGEEKRIEREENEARVFPGDLGKLESLKLKIKDTEIEIEKRGLDFWVTKPFVDLAADTKVSSVKVALERFKKTKDIKTKEESDPQKIDMVTFGLWPPVAELTLKSADQKDPSVIKVGGPNPAKTGTYLIHPVTGALVLGTSDLDFLATLKAKDFRESRMVSVPEPDYDEVSIKTDKDKIRFVRSTEHPEEWTMVEPYNVPLDQSYTKGQLEKIALLRANEFLSKVPPALKKPSIEILIGFKKDVKDKRSGETDPRPQGVLITLARLEKSKTPGSKISSYNYYAQSDKTEPAEVSQFHYDNFARRPADFVRKTFSHIPLAKVKSVSVALPIGQKYVVTAGKENEWALSSTKQNFTVAKPDFDRVVGHLLSLRAIGFEGTPKTPPASSQLKIEFILDDGTTYRFDYSETKTTGNLWLTENSKTYAYGLSPRAISAKDWAIDAWKPAPAADTNKPDTSNKGTSQ